MVPAFLPDARGTHTLLCEGMVSMGGEEPGFCKDTQG